MFGRHNTYDVREHFRWTDIPTGICFALALIALGLALAVHFRPMYYLSITWLDIPAESGLNPVIIRENYDALIDYCSPFFKGELVFPSLRSSASGISHFAECKELFKSIYIIGLICAVICGVSFFIKRKLGEVNYLMACAVSSIALPAVLVIAFLINFNAMFLLFHKITFSNDDWLFDPATDPVINILPEAFFMECALLICATVIIGGAIALVLYLRRKRRRKESSFVRHQKNYYYT